MIDNDLYGKTRWLTMISMQRIALSSSIDDNGACWLLMIRWAASVALAPVNPWWFQWSSSASVLIAVGSEEKILMVSPAISNTWWLMIVCDEQWQLILQSQLPLMLLQCPTAADLATHFASWENCVILELVHKKLFHPAESNQILPLRIEVLYKDSHHGFQPPFNTINQP